MLPELLGDPHLGRIFHNNVPLHRRCEREAMIWQRFEQAIRSTEAPMHVCLGDLFDAPLVSFDTIWRTAKAYWSASDTTHFVVLRGNHDASRDLERVSAFDLFTAIMRDRVEVIVEPTALDRTIAVSPGIRRSPPPTWSRASSSTARRSPSVTGTPMPARIRST